MTLAVPIVASVVPQHHDELKEADNDGIVKGRVLTWGPVLAQLCEDASGIEAIGAHQGPLAVSSIVVRNKIGRVTVITAFVPDAESPRSYLVQVTGRVCWPNTTNLKHRDQRLVSAVGQVDPSMRHEGIGRGEIA